MELSLGKRRGLASCSTKRGVFSILALDHRNNLRRAINPGNPEHVSVAIMAEFKSVLIRELSSMASAALLDPEFGAAQSLQSDSLPGQIGLVMALEATGYTGDAEARESRILSGWSVGKIRRIGASAVKLLVYYHPNSEMASQQEALVQSVSESCKKYDLAFFLEPLSYSLDPNRKLNSAEKRDVVIRTAEKLTHFGADVLKAEFPLDVKEDPNEAHWAEACQELSQASHVPWVLLSAGVDFDTFLRQLTIACQEGASGAMAGRAVWKEAVGLQGDDLISFLQNTGADRMSRLTHLCEALGKSWRDFYPTQSVSDAWYQTYQDI